MAPHLRKGKDRVRRDAGAVRGGTADPLLLSSGVITKGGCAEGSGLKTERAAPLVRLDPSQQGREMARAGRGA